MSLPFLGLTAVSLLPTPQEVSRRADTQTAMTEGMGRMAILWVGAVT